MPGRNWLPPLLANLVPLLGFLAVAQAQPAQEPAPAPAAPVPVAAAFKYDLLLVGGHVIDPRNKISAVRDVAIAGGKVAEVARKIDPAQAFKVVNVKGLYVTPGLIDIHAHVYTGVGEPSSYAGANSVAPDGFTFRSGVTTVVDAGGSGWRNFPDFKQRVIDRAKTRVFSFINIVGHGMRGGRFEQDLADMEAKPTAEMALAHKGIIVGVKTAHYSGPEWAPVERAVEAGTIASIPVMVDFGRNRPERPLTELLTSKLRPGDIYTHVHSGLRKEQDESGKVSAGLWEGQKRGVFLDVGHGSGSFVWRVAVPAVKEGLVADSLSTDLHVNSMNSGMKNSAQCHVQVPGPGAAAGRRGVARDLEPGARDQTRGAGPSIGGRAGRHRGPAARSRKVRVRRLVRRPPGRNQIPHLRAHPARRAGGL